MAGVPAQESCRGCTSTSCACGDQGTWSEPSLLSQRLSEGSPGHQLLEKWTSTWGSLSGPASGAERTRSGEAAAARDEDRPLVFLCAGCRRPLGDSLSWVAGPEASCILLRSVSSNVSVDTEQILSKRENESGCILETLRCAGCALPLGHIYRSTPGHLDYKRDLFCLGAGATESYVLGSSEKHIVSEDKAFGLESRTEIENSLKQRGREREREPETSIGCLLHASYWECARNQDGRRCENPADKAAGRGNEVVLRQFQVRAVSLVPLAASG